MAENHHVGRKYLWVGNEGVLEMHGEEKMAWTKLEEHIFRKRLKSHHNFAQLISAKKFLSLVKRIYTC